MAETRKKAAAGSVLAYDAEAGRGAGYGSASGDDRVHRLQAALNRLGLKDADGKPLKVDGKLGPKTAAVIEAAQKRLGLTPNGRVTPALLDKLAAAKRMSDVKVTPAGGKAKRSLPEEPEEASMLTRSGPQLYDRSFPLDDIQISRSGDGRTVEAYAAMFDMPYEVRDQHGHYMEVIHRAAFNRTLSGGAGRNAMCLYNHGMSVVDGKPDSLAQVPLGLPLEIKPDGRGLLTVTRYNEGPFADSGARVDPQRRHQGPVVPRPDRALRPHGPAAPPPPGHAAAHGHPARTRARRLRTHPDPGQLRRRNHGRPLRRGPGRHVRRTRRRRASENSCAPSTSTRPLPTGTRPTTKTRTKTSKNSPARTKRQAPPPPNGRSSAPRTRRRKRCGTPVGSPTSRGVSAPQ
jgi:hypothetical protein